MEDSRTRPTKTCLPSHNPLLHRPQTLLWLPKRAIGHECSAAQILERAYLVYSFYFPLLLVLVLLPLLSCFVKVANEAFLVSMVAQAILVVRSGRGVIGNENLAIFAPVLLM